MKRIYIVGAGGHAKVVADLAMLCGTGPIHGFVDTISPQRRGEDFYGGKVVGTLDDLFQLTSSLARDQLAAIVAIGDCRARMLIATQLEEAGIELLTLVHPSAAVSRSAILGKGTVVFANASVNADSILGKNVIVNTGAGVEHDCSIGDGTHIAPRAVMGGFSRVGTASMLGIGSVVRDRICIGSNVTIGAGSVVVKNIPDLAVAYGNPARIARFHDGK